jgi:predicted Zn-ribbon and HTH transcriptional regulator
MTNQLPIIRELIEMVDSTKLTPEQIERFFEIRLMAEQETLKQQLEEEKAQLLQMKETSLKTCKLCGYQWKGRVENPPTCPNCKSRRWNKEPPEPEPEPEPEHVPLENAFCPSCNSLLSGKNQWRCSNPKCSEYEQLREMNGREKIPSTKLTVVNKFCMAKCGELADKLTELVLAKLMLCDGKYTVGDLATLLFNDVADLIKRDLDSRGQPWNDVQQKGRVNASIHNIFKRLQRWLKDGGQEPEEFEGGIRYIFEKEHYFIITATEKGHNYSMEKFKNTEGEDDTHGA